MTNEMIPAEAVAAARGVLYDQYYGGTVNNDQIRDALEAASPYMKQRRALSAVCKAISDAAAFGRQASHHDILAAMRKELGE